MLYMILGLLFIQMVSFPQPPDGDLCSTSEAHQMDFWLGDWNVEWKNTDSTISKGTNHVINLFDGSCVIEENFDGMPGTSLIGKSFSVYDRKERLWKQTWVDNGGTYLDFTGAFKDGKMILTRETADKNGSPVMQKMIYYNISKNDFDWNWEISHDTGKTWDLKWKIHYKRMIE